MKTMDQYFVDWEAETFGYGYGTGEGFIIPKLMQFMAMCDREPTGACYHHLDLEKEIGPETTWFLINTLCRVDIIEYGSSPRFGFLTDQGKALRDYLSDKNADLILGLIFSGRDQFDMCGLTYCNCQEGLCDNPFWVAPKDRE